MMVGIRYNEKTFKVPLKVRGAYLLKLAEEETDTNLYLRHPDGEVVKINETGIYEIQKGDLIQKLNDFVLG